MKKLFFASALALAACGQPAPEPAAPAAPQSLMDLAQAQSAEMLPVFGYQQLVAYLQAHPELNAVCTGPRAAESRGVVPDNAAAGSVYAEHKGSLALSVQCGEQLTTVRDDPAQHWLVFLAPAAMDAVVVNCADGRNDKCPHVIPTDAAPAAP